MKNPLVRYEGFIVIVLALGYIGMTFYSLVRWNEAISGALVTGFALFAQESLKSFWALVKVYTVPDDTTTQALPVQPPKDPQKAVT